MASELTLILTDFFLPAVSLPAAQLPRLPALEILLSRSRRSRLPQGWRGWLAERALPPGQRAGAPAALAATGWLGAPPAGATVWFATPLHYFAGLDSLHLHPAGLLQLMAMEQFELAAGFNALYDDTSWRLEALGARELLLYGPALDASAAEPALWPGRDPASGWPSGPDASVLRRLGTEIEMWLHEHPVNERRAARAELAVTGLWLWGGRAEPGPVSTAPLPVASAPTLYGSDLYAEGLWRLAGARHEPLPAGYGVLPAGTRALVLIPTWQAEGLTNALLGLEREWLAPALVALRARSLRSLQLIAGALRFELSSFGLARLWRRLGPWWERLA